MTYAVVDGKIPPGVQLHTGDTVKFNLEVDTPDRQGITRTVTACVAAIQNAFPGKIRMNSMGTSVDKTPTAAGMYGVHLTFDVIKNPFVVDDLTAIIIGVTILGVAVTAYFARGAMKSFEVISGSAGGQLLFGGLGLVLVVAAGGAALWYFGKRR